jgi:hypothetical protein
LEGGLHFWSSLEGLLLFREFSQWFHNVGKTGNKLSIISAEAQEASYFVLVIRDWPFPYGFQFLRVTQYARGTILPSKRIALLQIEL